MRTDIAGDRMMVIPVHCLRPPSPPEVLGTSFEGLFHLAGEGRVDDVASDKQCQRVLHEGLVDIFGLPFLVNYLSNATQSTIGLSNKLT